MAFDGLTTHLLESKADRIVLSLEDIERLEGRDLPPSAHKHAAFWSNTSSYARAWRAAGYRASRRGLADGQIAFERDAPSEFNNSEDGTTVRTSIDRRPTVQRGTEAVADILLVGCVKTKLEFAAPAKDLYVSPMFRKRRAYAEESGLPWYILSALHGLLTPHALIEPYDVYLPDEPETYRRAWGEWVAAQLARTDGPLAGKSVEIHAGSAYVEATRSGLERRGARLLTPLDGLSMGPQLAWYAGSRPLTYDKVNAPPEMAEMAEMAEMPIVESDLKAESSRLESLLREQTFALSPAGLAAADLDEAGLYSWWVDPLGAIELSVGLGHDVSGLIYAGQTGADSSRLKINRRSTLRGRLIGNHLRGSIEGSTFRLTLAAALRDRLTDSPHARFDRSAEERLSQWMANHLTVVAVPVEDRSSLAAIEERVVQALDPPLNIQHVAKTPLREALTIKRRSVRTA